MPLRNNSQFGHNMWYTFENGPVTYVAISTETNYPDAFYEEYNFKGDQMAWLEQTLARVDRKRTPWLIVLGHRPIYSSKVGYSDAAGDVSGQSVRVQAAFEELIYKYHVDIMMNGHVHSYERTHPVYKRQVETTSPKLHNIRSPIHIINGAGGNIEGITPDFLFYYGHNWTANIYNEDEGYGILRTLYDAVSKIHTLKFDFHSATSNAVVDSVVITKDAF